MKPKHLSILSLFLLFLSIFSVFILSQKKSSPEMSRFSPISQVNAQEQQFSSCKFTKGDQNPKDLPYQSPLLLSYFQGVSAKTGVPATLLAAIARVESTTSTYTISNYTDADVQAMEDTQQIVDNIDKKIDGVKARCPVSGVGALGVMQVMPSRPLGESIVEQLKKTRPQCTPELENNGVACWNPYPGGHPESGVRLGASFIGKSYESLTVQDYCNPQNAIYFAAGVILKKLQALGHGDGTKWDPAWNNDQNIFNKVAESYYGCLKYPSCQNGPNSYGDDLWNSFQGCKVAASPNTPPSSGGVLLMESNEVITRVGNPQTNPVLADASCPVPNGEITCASYGPAESWGGFHGTCAVDNEGNGGHCSNIYQSRVGICTKRTSAGSLIRTAKSIDITAKGGNSAGDPVYLPSINGKTLTWYYKGVQSAGGSFGWIRLFQSEPTPEGVWSIHFVHANTDNPPLAIDQPVKSGEIGATMYNLGDGIHIHVTVGLNVGDSVNNLQDYNPGWKFADRDLGMCTK